MLARLGGCVLELCLPRMTRNPFPNVPHGQPVGSLGGRLQMESMEDVTLRGMAKGEAGEPDHVIRLAVKILGERRRAGQT